MAVNWTFQNYIRCNKYPKSIQNIKIQSQLQNIHNLMQCLSQKYSKDYPNILMVFFKKKKT